MLVLIYGIPMKPMPFTSPATPLDNSPLSSNRRAAGESFRLILLQHVIPEKLEGSRLVVTRIQGSAREPRQPVTNRSLHRRNGGYLLDGQGRNRIGRMDDYCQAIKRHRVFACIRRQVAYSGNSSGTVSSLIFLRTCQYRRDHLSDPQGGSRTMRMNFNGFRYCVTIQIALNERLQFLPSGNLLNTVGSLPFKKGFRQFWS